MYLSASATTPTVVRLKSNNSALAVPSAVTVSEGAHTTGFNAVTSAVSQSITVTITGTLGDVSKTDAITLYPSQSAAATLSKVSCGTQTLTGPTTKGCSVYLSSAATSPMTVTLKTDNASLQVPSSVTVAAGAMTAGFGATASAVSTPETATISASSGGVTQTEVLQLETSGTQASVPHQVQLSWNAAPVSSDPAVGYRVYRSGATTSSYQLLNSSIDTSTTYVDITVQSGQSYSYLVKSVDSSHPDADSRTRVGVVAVLAEVKGGAVA